MDFQTFWEIYPRRVAKGVARKAWAKIDRTTQAFIISHLEIRVKDDEAWVNGDKCFIPHPASWLNGERWEDEYQTLQQPKPKSLKQMDDRELFKLATEKRIRTAGKDRFELIKAIIEGR